MVGAGVVADSAIGHRERAVLPVVDAAAEEAAKVAADGAVGQGGRVGGRRGTTAAGHAAAVASIRRIAGRVSADDHVGQRQRAVVAAHATAIVDVSVVVGETAGDRHARQRHRAELNVKHSSVAVPADRQQVGPGPSDRRGAPVGQLELAAGQGDPLRAIEKVGEDDRVAPAVRVCLGNRRAQRTGAAVAGVADSQGREQCAALEFHHHRPQFQPGSDGSRSTFSSSVPRSDANHINGPPGEEKSDIIHRPARRPRGVCQEPLPRERQRWPDGSDGWRGLFANPETYAETARKPGGARSVRRRERRGPVRAATRQNRFFLGPRNRQIKEFLDPTRWRWVESSGPHFTGKAFAGGPGKSALSRSHDHRRE